MKRLVAPWFGERKFRRLARVLEYTASQHCPDWEIDVRHVDPPEVQAHKQARRGHVFNTQKMATWVEAVREAENGDKLLLIDADCMITGSLDDVWEYEFDVAYTVKDSRFPFNSGVVFLQVNQRSREFVELWWAENARLLSDYQEHQRWRKIYGGINQAALGSVLDADEHGANLLPLPCQIWNCEDSSWEHFNADTRIVHCKSRLRRELFGSPGKRRNEDIQPLIDLWQQAEAEAERGAHAEEAA